MTKLTVNLGPGRSYDVLLSPGILSRAGEHLDLDRRVFIVTDAGVPERYAAVLASQCRTPVTLRLPQGEGAKTLQSLEVLLRAMLDAGFTRSDCVCAVGGGMPGDLAGFAAACYMRGLDFYNLPTTVLSQVDSSVGGKTAVNLDGVKNVVGAFYQPRRVLIDPDTLATLSPVQTAAGLAEAVKAGLIGDGDLFRRFETAPAATQLPEIVAAALRVKKAVVERDEREAGLRKILNFGHTIGHGIESVTGLPHGVCVGLGMLPVCAPPVRDRLTAVLRSLDLPVTVRGDPAAVYAAALHDKKARRDGALTLVRVEEVGKAIMEDVPAAALRPLIEQVVLP